jgi:hypothetical protein
MAHVDMATNSPLFAHYALALAYDESFDANGRIPTQPLQQRPVSPH